MVFLVMAILSGVRWKLSVGLIYILFMAEDVEHFFMDLFDIFTSSFENCLSNSFDHF
jgi:hypothetical protein